MVPCVMTRWVAIDSIRLGAQSINQSIKRDCTIEMAVLVWFGGVSHPRRTYPVGILPRPVLSLQHGPDGRHLKYIHACIHPQPPPHTVLGLG